MTGAPVNEGKDARPGLAAREAAARLLAAVVDKKVSLDGLTDHANGNPAFLALERRDRELVRAILVTALRFRNTVEALINARLDRPLPDNARLLSHILHVAAAQILFLNIPDHAAVDLAVAHAGSDPRTRRFTGLVNAVLRKISGRKERALPAALAQTNDCPQWFHERLVGAYGAELAAAIVAMHRHEAAIDLTVKTAPDYWADTLGGRVMPNGSVRLGNSSDAIPGLPGFAEGQWWVQDAAAAMPVCLLGEISGKRVADLCAAPGGKTAQIALAGANVTAVDISANRLKKLRDNLTRLNLEAKIVVSAIADFEPEQTFDAVLLDAPCSSTGTIRRHPDIPWVKSARDIDNLAAVQTRLLTRAVSLAAPGGTIVFANCSLDPVEGEQLYEAFLANNPDVEHHPIAPNEIPGAAKMVTTLGTLRTTPADWPADDPKYAGLDGFFAARMRRK